MHFFFSGSQSEQFEQSADSNNPLPPCPDSPNCVRLTKQYDIHHADLLKKAEACLKKMGPEDMELMETKGSITVIFKVFIFKDDLKILVEEVNETSSLLHLRSSSREGYSDLGVNRRRVKRFIKLLKKQL